MSADIVTRLREHADDEGMLGNDLLARCLWDGADEIERLRRERLEWFLVARQLKDAAMAIQEADEALNDYMRIRGRLEDPRDAVGEASSE